MKEKEFITERTRIISEMLDNPDDNGIYPTTKCFEQLDELFNRKCDMEAVTTSQRQLLIEFADWFTAKDGNEAEVDAFLENNE